MSSYKAKTKDLSRLHLHPEAHSDYDHTAFGGAFSSLIIIRSETRLSLGLLS